MQGAMNKHKMGQKDVLIKKSNKSPYEANMARLTAPSSQKATANKKRGNASNPKQK